jgi:hypothetical protein
MTHSLTIERDGKQAIIAVRMLAHDPQYVAGSRIKWGSGKMWRVIKVELTYDQIIANAAESAVQHCRALACQGVCAPLRLYYKVGALALQSEAITHDMAADGYQRTERLLQCNVPYDNYSNWIRRNSGDLPIFA